MSLTARDLMKQEPRTVHPGMSLPDLERTFLDEQVGGFPVVEGKKLVGVVSRSDVVRQLSVEHTLGEVLSDYYREFQELDPASIEPLESHLGQRHEKLCVRDVMIPGIITVSPDTPVRDLARRMLEERIHRLPVVEGERLVGIVTSSDVVRAVAEGSLVSTS